jgi:hypothetical protein
MTDPTGLAVALAATEALNAAELELANLRAHIDAIALDDVPAWTARRSAGVVAALVDGVAGQLRDLAVRQGSAIA